MSGVPGRNSDVSRETSQRLDAFVTLLAKWNKRINLVAPSSIADIWTRHIRDSAQLFDHAPPDCAHWVDLGSGGGLPGIVCAVLAREKQPDCKFTLIESDKRKAAFLITACRELDLSARVLAERIEHAEPQNADVVSARALAPLPQLLPLVARHVSQKGIALLPKGKNHLTELAAAGREWQFKSTIVQSQTDPLAKLLILKEIARV